VVESVRHVRVAIVGTGFAGLGMAIQLKRRGENDFVVLERARDVGGTWRDNTYPGAACDIRSDLYSFSFAPNPDWAYSYGRQPEILNYLRDTARQFDVVPHILFERELERAEWNDDAAAWTLTTSRETLTADVLVAGHGPLIEPVWPSIPGLESFAGASFHSARWDHSVSLKGKRIAVIGTGASSIQLVPELQQVASQLTLFQRTPPWIIPRADRPTSERRRRLFRRYPALQRASRSWIFRMAEVRFIGFRSAFVGRLFQVFATWFRNSQVHDPRLRQQLTPNYRVGCKRILVSSNFYPTLSQPNVELVTNAIVRIDNSTLVTADGARREFDVLVCGTGFDATHPPIAALIHGRNNESLRHAWSDRMSALHGTTVAGFPNLFLLVGPNTSLGHNSMIYIIEAQIDYVLQALELLRSSGARSLEPLATAQDDYNSGIQSDLEGSVWTSGGCTSFYLDATGRNTTLWPQRAGLFRRSVRSFRADEYVVDHGVREATNA
jgi:cation diffusion facilitator CzcD-associated flavoprotein CzcO